MNKNKPTILVIIIFLLTVNYAKFEENKILRRVNQYPEKEDDYFFRSIIDLDIRGKYLYAAENFGHKILKFSIDGELNFVESVGKYGREPGEVIFPAVISIWNDKIAVKDNISYSIFDLKGKFLSKFRAFSSKKPFVYVNNKIFWTNFNPDDMHLVEVYSSEGKKISEFGKKFLSIDFSLFEGIPSFAVEKYVYDGNLLSDGKHIYYLNSTFGRLMKFELDGFKVLEKDIGHLFGQPGRKAIEENRKHWIKTGFDVGEDHTIPIYPIFIDAYLFGGKIYLITTSGTSEKKAENELVRIIVLDKDSLQLKDQYKLMKENDETIICFCVGGNEDSPSFYVSMETEKGNIIAEYSVKNEI